jgi:hypothetical protein
MIRIKSTKAMISVVTAKLLDVFLYISFESIISCFLIFFKIFFFWKKILNRYIFKYFLNFFDVLILKIKKNILIYIQAKKYF